MSICIPAYNAAAHIGEALESVRAQTHREWELRVIEDGSYDGTEQLVRRFAASVAQAVQYDRHVRNKGLPATRNSAIRSAIYDTVALLDADDYWDRRHVESTLGVLKRSQADIAHSGSVLFESGSGQIIGIRAPSEIDVKDFPESLIRAKYVIQPASVILRREIWRRAGGFDETFRYVEDREMWWRCARAGARFAYSGAHTCFYRRHANALSTHARAMAAANANAAERHLDWQAISEIERKHVAIGEWSAVAGISQRCWPRSAARFVSRAQRISWHSYRSAWRIALLLYSALKMR